MLLLVLPQYKKILSKEILNTVMFPVVYHLMYFGHAGVQGDRGTPKPLQLTIA